MYYLFVTIPSANCYILCSTCCSSTNDKGGLPFPPTPAKNKNKKKISLNCEYVRTDFADKIKD